MRWITISLMIFGSLVFSLSLLNIDTVVSDEAVTVVLTFDSTPTYKMDSDFSKTSFTLTIPNAIVGFSGGTLPVRTGPLEMVNVITMGGSIVVSFHTIIPSKPIVVLNKNVLKVIFPRSRQRIDVVFTGGVDLKTAVNYLAEYLKLNVIVSDSVSGRIVDLKLNRITPEDALRSLMMSLDDVFYSYFSDGTMFIGNYNEVSNKFAKFWGVYKAGADIVEVLKDALPDDAFVNYVKNKSLLFVYGTPETHRIISALLSKGPPTTEVKFNYDGADKNTISAFLEDLKKLYGSFDYIFVPNTTQIIIKGDINIVEKVVEKLKEILPPPIVEEKEGKVRIEVLDSDEAVKVLKERLGLDAERVSDRIIAIPKDIAKEKVVDVLRESGLLPKSWRSLTLPIYMKNYIGKIANIAGIPDRDVVTIDLETGDKLILYVRGDPGKIDYFLKLVKDFEEKLTGEKWRYTKIVDLGLKGDVLGEISKLVSDYLGGSVSITPYPGLGSVMIRAESLKDLEEAEKILRRKAGEIKAQEEAKTEVKPEIGERWVSSVLSVDIPKDYVDQVRSYINFATNGEVQMEYYPDLNRAILKSKSEYLLDRAKELLADAVSKLPRYVEMKGETKESESVRIIQRIKGITDEDISKIANLFGVSVVPVDGGYILKGKEGDLWNFNDLLDRIRNLSGFGKVVEVVEKPSNLPKEVLDYLKSKFKDVYAVDLGTRVLLIGSKSSVDELVSIYGEISKSLPKVAERKSVFKIIRPKLQQNDIEKIAEIFDVSVTSLSAGFLVAGFQENISEFEKFLKEYSKDIDKESVVALEKFEGITRDMIDELKKSHPNVSIFETRDHVIVMGRKDEVSSFEKTYKELEKKLSAVSKKTVVRIEEVGKGFLFNDYSDFLKAIGLKVQVFYMENVGVLVMKGSERELEKAKSYLDRFKPGKEPEGFLKTMKYPEGFPIEEFLRAVEGNFNLKVTAIENSRIMVITGKDEKELSKFEKFYTEFSGKIGKVEKREKIEKFLSIPKDFPIQPFVDTVKKTVEGVDVVPYSDLGYVLVLADSTSQIDSVLDVYKRVLKIYTETEKPTETKVVERKEKFYEFLSIPDGFPVDSFVKSVQMSVEGVELIPYPKHIYVVADSKDSLERVKKMLSEIVKEYVPQKKEDTKIGKPVKKEKYNEFLKITDNFPVDSFIQSVQKTVEGVEIVPYKDVGYILVISDSEDEIEKVKKMYQKVLGITPKAVEETKVEKEEEFVKILTYPKDFPIDDFLKGIEGMFKLKISLVKSMNRLVISGSDEKEYERFKTVYDDFLKGLKKEKVKVSLDIPKGFPIDQFIDVVKSTLPTVEITPYPDLGYMIVEAESEEDISKVGEMLKKAIEKMEKEPKEERKLVWVEDGSINVEAQGVSLFDVINELFKVTGKSVVFRYSPTEEIHMSLRKVSFDKFIKILEDYGVRIKLEDGIYIVDKIQREEEKAKEETKTPGYRIYKVYHNFERIKNMVELFGGSAYIDEETGNLVITGLDDEKIKIVEKMMNEISKPLKQVEIEARIIDRSIIDELEKRRNLNLNIPISEDENVEISSDSIKLNASVMSAQDYEKFLSALKSGIIELNITDRKSNDLNEILASPRITTTSGKEARILIGDKIPYIITSPEGQTTVGYVTPGIELRITPTVRDDGTIDMTIFTKVSDPLYVEGVNFPGEKTREAQTQVIINNGDTVVIGGLTRDITVKGVAKLPVLGDLPIIGQFFRSETERKERRELIIFITAKVVSEW